MNISKSIKNLKTYIREDEIYQKFKNGEFSVVNEKGIKEISDFDRFCIDHCKDIEKVLNTIQQQNNNIDNGIELINQWKEFCRRNITEKPCDTIQIQNNIYWKDCISHLDYLIKKFKGEV